MRAFVETDYPELQKWISARGLETKMKPSAIGAIEPGVAAGFLYITDSNVAFIEFMISNPLAEAAKRDVACCKIVESLLALAQELGFEVVLAITDHPNQVRRGIEAGCIARASTLLIKEFN